ncbi:hypothetical protein [Streptomyces acidiscabies]|uniref:Uncharacterized protein n=1 Tax=Streptomyces acidiscabies TaxID=42234 RepID=A0ABU4LW80_9ACTN|nr:hypothetical protein [Streptomyces acidiscabies]MDX3020014.1 hypothetical protein [Streptomyces acidiscabies]
MQHIFHEGDPVAQGETFEPVPGYTVIFVRIEQDRLILRDSGGEFSRPIISTQSEPRKPRSPRLAERRTVLEEVPDARPIEGETIYLMTHQMCVPGGWEGLATQRLRAPQHLAGIYGPVGQMLGNREVRHAAAQLFEVASKKVAKHPLTRLATLVTTADLQEGEEDESGAWNDPGVAMEICQILRGSKIL